MFNKTQVTRLSHSLPPFLPLAAAMLLALAGIYYSLLYVYRIPLSFK